MHIDPDVDRHHRASFPELVFHPERPATGLSREGGPALIGSEERDARYEQRRRQGHLDHQIHLDRLFQVTLIPDTSNEHRCLTVGVLDAGSDRCDEGYECSAELVQCESYLGHETVSDHLNGKAYGNYVYWRDST
jgi:hypothetical protein